MNIKQFLTSLLFVVSFHSFAGWKVDPSDPVFATKKEAADNFIIRFSKGNGEGVCFHNYSDWYSKIYFKKMWSNTFEYTLVTYSNDPSCKIPYRTSKTNRHLMYVDSDPLPQDDCAALDGQTAPFPRGKKPKSEKLYPIHLYCPNQCEAVSTLVGGGGNGVSLITRKYFYTGHDCIASDNDNAQDMYKTCSYYGGCGDDYGKEPSAKRDPFPGCYSPDKSSDFYVCRKDTNKDGYPDIGADYDMGADCGNMLDGKFTCAGGSFKPLPSLECVIGSVFYPLCKTKFPKPTKPTDKDKDKVKPTDPKDPTKPIAGTGDKDTVDISTEDKTEVGKDKDKDKNKDGNKNKGNQNNGLSSREVSKLLNSMRTDSNARLDKVFNELKGTTSETSKVAQGVTQGFSTNHSDLQAIKSSNESLKGSVDALVANGDDNTNKILNGLKLNRNNTKDIKDGIDSLEDALTNNNASSVGGDGVCNIGKCESMYTKTFENGLEGVFSDKFEPIQKMAKQAIDNNFNSVDFSGGARPNYLMSFDFGFFNYGSYDLAKIANLGMIFTFLRAFFIACCALYCRQLIFGG